MLYALSTVHSKHIFPLVRVKLMSLINPKRIQIPSGIHNHLKPLVNRGLKVPCNGVKGEMSDVRC